jgi:hypothetical protein
MTLPVIQLDGVFDALARRGRGGLGRALMFVAARRGEGLTTIACAAAQQAPPGPVYAIDLDLGRNGLARALSDVGALGPRAAPPFGEAQLVSMSGAFGFHRVGATRIYAGVFDARMAQGARVTVAPGSAFWDAVRASGAAAIVEAPALERGLVALRVARHMDGVVLVVGSGAGAAPAALAAKRALEGAGVEMMGLVYTGADAPVMAIERALSRAG